MPVRLVALDDSPDIAVDRAVLVVGRHPQCDARLDSIRVSRRHCCMTQDNGEVVVRDLGSTNGIRINGQRVEVGRLRMGDELSIAHIRYRLENGQAPEATVADPGLGNGPGPAVAALRLMNEANHAHPAAHDAVKGQVFAGPHGDNPLAAAVREMLPAAMADRCRIQVIVQMDPGAEVDAALPEAQPECRPD
jgi:predicted component of type VI protein secretion system